MLTYVLVLSQLVFFLSFLLFPVTARHFFPFFFPGHYSGIFPPMSSSSLHSFMCGVEFWFKAGLWKNNIALFNPLLHLCTFSILQNHRSVPTIAPLPSSFTPRHLLCSLPDKVSGMGGRCLGKTPCPRDRKYGHDLAQKNSSIVDQMGMCMQTDTLLSSANYLLLSFNSRNNHIKIYHKCEYSIRKKRVERYHWALTVLLS